MSRVSLSRRIDRIRDHLLVPGTLRWRLERADDAVREDYANWKERTDAAYSATEKWSDNVYGAMLDDPAIIPPMSGSLRYALFPHLKAVDAEVEISNKHAAAGRTEAAETAMVRAYAMLQGDEE